MHGAGSDRLRRGELIIQQHGWRRPRARAQHAQQAWWVPVRMYVITEQDVLRLPSVREGRQH